MKTIAIIGTCFSAAAAILCLFTGNWAGAVANATAAFWACNVAVLEARLAR